MLCADLGQVWVVGCSNGGMMVYEALADARTAGVFAGGVSIVGAPHPGFLRMPSAPAHLLGIWGLDDAMIPYAANTNRSGVAFAPGGDAGGWYYTAARNITQAWSAHHGGPLEPVPSDDGSGDVSCQTFVGASVETVECVVPDGHVCGRADRFRVHSGTTDRLEQ
jgi:poly(3-hydroxybutyrate) depolymerase